MKILLTGSKGFIGSYIYNELKDIYDIVCIDIFHGVATDKGYHCIDLVNITLIDNFLNSIRDIDIIIHSAALAHNKGTDLSFNKFKEINFEATKNLVDLSNKYLTLKNFIFFSTISVYGEKIDKDIYYETDEANPKTPYAITKKMSEDYITANLKAPYTILRFSPVYGENFTLNIDRRTLARNKLYRAGNGNNKLSLLNVKNILIAIKFIIENTELFNDNIFNLSDNKIYTFNDLINYQLNKFGSKRIIEIPRIFFYFSYLLGRIIKNNFLLENSVKLISDNVYDTSKISSKIYLPYELNSY